MRAVRSRPATPSRTSSSSAWGLLGWWILPIGRRRSPRGRGRDSAERLSQPGSGHRVGIVPRCLEPPIRRASPATPHGGGGTWRGTRCSTTSRSSAGSGRPTSSTTTASGRAATATPRSPRRRGASRPGCWPPGWPRAITPSSGARTVPNGWSPSGDACAPGWWWCQSTPAPRRRSWSASPGWCRRGSSSSAMTWPGRRPASLGWCGGSAISTGATARRRRWPSAGTTSPRSSSPRVRPASRRASSSLTATSWRTSFRSRAKSPSTGAGPARCCRCACSTCCRSATCSGSRWPRSFPLCCRRR